MTDALGRGTQCGQDRSRQAAGPGSTATGAGGAGGGGTNVDAQIARRAQDETAAARLWEISEALPNTRWTGATQEYAS
ncbi:hypothetical protein LMG27177_02973 [Paraburkholderia fynbosensis]|uniref:Uncharacterized protein n=1 Tax=Paraburkholderia fynbosensis TaxID=1200993 RepID=A0A6J5G0A5_9BURK|nr:hypothetical protein LMG27177_02973 [Paraburkholderia fynbosensis]